MLELNEIRGAVARGWCSEINLGKIMDCDLTEAISLEIDKLIRSPKQPATGAGTSPNKQSTPLINEKYEKCLRYENGKCGCPYFIK